MSSQASGQGQKGNSPRFDVIFVVQGKEFKVTVNANQAIKGAVQQALKDSGNQGSSDGWELRTGDGRRLDLSKSFEDEGITQTVKVFLSRGPGRGG